MTTDDTPELTTLPITNPGDVPEENSQYVFVPNKQQDFHKDPAVLELTRLIGLMQDPKTSKLKRERAEKRVRKILKQHLHQH